MSDYYSKIENNQIVLNLEYFDLNKAIEEATDMISLQINLKGIKFIIDKSSKYKYKFQHYILEKCMQTKCDYNKYS